MEPSVCETSESAPSFGLTFTYQTRHQALWKLRTHFKTNAALARYLELPQTACGRLINLQIIPGKKMRKRLEPKLAALGYLCDDLWPAALAKSGLVGSKLLKRELDKQVPFEHLESLTGHHEALQIVDDGTNVIEKIERTQLRSFLEKEIEGVSPRQARVLRLRYGLDDGEPKTQQEVAEVLGVGRMMVSYIETAALRKLRKNKQVRQLAKEYMEY